MEIVKNPFPENTWEAGAYEAGRWLLGADVETTNLEEAFDKEDWRSIFILAWHKNATMINDLVVFLAGKQHDYGPQNVLKFGMAGLKVRLWDKIARINNLIMRDAPGINESLQDSYTDLMGYCVIMVMLEQGTFTLPLTQDVPPPTVEAQEGWPVYSYRQPLKDDTMFYDDAFTIEQIGVTPEGQPVLSCTRVYR